MRDVEAYMAEKRRGSALYNEIGDEPRHTAIVARYYSCNLESNAKKAEPHTTEGYSPKAEFDGFLRKDEALLSRICLHPPNKRRRTYGGCRFETVPGVGMRGTELRKLK